MTAVRSLFLALLADATMYIFVCLHSLTQNTWEPESGVSHLDIIFPEYQKAKLEKCT